MTLTSQYLIEKELHVVRTEWLRRDNDLMQVTLEEFCQHVSVRQELRKPTRFNWLTYFAKKNQFL